MKKRLWALLPLIYILTGCGIGSKTASISVVYGAAAILSGVLLLCVCLSKERQPWLIVLFSSVMVVNIGYWALSVSPTLEWALNANRIAYLGSVALPLSMLMIALKVIGIRCPKWLPYGLIGLAVVVFVIAASPGFSTVYYKEVSLQVIDGASSLKKVYGPLHHVYMFYLMGYFVAMTTIVIASAIIRRKFSSAHAVVLLIAVFVNICVWLIGQLVDIEFEFLAVSYIITEMFLMGLYVLPQDQPEPIAVEVEVLVPVPEPMPSIQPVTVDLEEVREQFIQGLRELTPTERSVYELYVSGKSTKEIMATLNIKENTLKFHNKNLYSKLEVSSRKQLLEIYRQLSKNRS